MKIMVKGRYWTTPQQTTYKTAENDLPNSHQCYESDQIPAQTTRKQNK